MPIKFDIITIFPDILDSYFNESILKRAQQDKRIEIKVHNLRNWTKDKHKTVDDTPYGGGPGMVMKVGPIYRAVADIKDKHLKARTILLAAKGRALNQEKVVQLAEYEQVILICGRYEGIDERVARNICDEEISVGPYVLSGGELPAAIIVDSVSRLIPGVLGNKESLSEESYPEESLEYPQYTKPADFKGWKVPDVLLSGDHQKIKEWRSQNKSQLL